MTQPTPAELLQILDREANRHAIDSLNEQAAVLQHPGPGRPRLPPELLTKRTVQLHAYVTPRAGAEIRDIGDGSPTAGVEKLLEFWNAEYVRRYGNSDVCYP